MQIEDSARLSRSGSIIFNLDRGMQCEKKKELHLVFEVMGGRKSSNEFSVLSSQGLSMNGDRSILPFDLNRCTHNILIVLASPISCQLFGLHSMCTH